MILSYLNWFSILHILAWKCPRWLKNFFHSIFYECSLGSWSSPDVKSPSLKRSHIQPNILLKWSGKREIHAYCYQSSSFKDNYVFPSQLDSFHDIFSNPTIFLSEGIRYYIEENWEKMFSPLLHSLSLTNTSHSLSINFEKWWVSKRPNIAIFCSRSLFYGFFFVP